MLRLLEDLPVELVGTNVLGYLSLKDSVMLERACGSMKSHLTFMEQIPHRPPVVLPSWIHNNMSILQWFTKKQCKIYSITMELPDDNPGLHVKNLKVVYFKLYIGYDTTIESLKHLLEYNVGSNVEEIIIWRNVNKEVIEQLSICTGNVKQLHIRNSNNCIDWLTADILSRWKLMEITFDYSVINELYLPR